MLEAVYDFITNFTTAKPDNIFQGYQNRMALPPEESYAVISVEGVQRVGTNLLDTSLSANSQITSSVMREYSVSVDFIGIDQDEVLGFANTLENVGRSYLAVDFFKTYNISFNYVDETEYLPFTGETDQYLHRYRIRLHFTEWQSVTVTQQYADNVEINRVENIDAHHKP